MDRFPLSFSEFDAVDYNQWLGAAQLPLKGKQPEEVFAWPSAFGGDLLPYYNEEHAVHTGYLYHFFLQMPAYQWVQYEPVYVDDERKANQHALDALMSGCNGVLFILDKKTDVQSLTKHIEWQHCHVAFYDHTETDEMKSKLLPHIEKGYYLQRSTHSGFCDEWFEDDPVENTVSMLLDYLSYPVDKPIVFLNAGLDYFHEMSRIRGIRYLLHRVATQSGRAMNPGDLQIHVQPVFQLEKDENWFAQSVVCTSSLLGGAQSISLKASEGYDRTSRNIGNIIRFESKIDTFQDAVSGSYFIDYLTDGFIQKVWTQFQKRV